MSLESFHHIFHPHKNRSGWGLLLAGLALWTLAQGSLVSYSVWTRDLPPETDDSLAYLVRTQEMEECFLQDCPALQDLRWQRAIGLTEPGVVRAHELSSFPFPFYHPLFSLLILGVKALVGDLVTAYKILWTLSPLLYGAAFASLLAALWGRATAGVALGLLAFKVFPDTGLQYFTPSNLALASAALMWARIIVRRGDAPWTLIVGSLLLILIHPIGGIHAALAAVFALLTSSRTTRKRVWLTIAATLLLFGIASLLASFIRTPSLFNALATLDLAPSPADFLSACSSNLMGILVGVSRLKGSLFGEPALFLFAATAGFLMKTGEQRSCIRRIVLGYALILVLAIYPTHAVSPAGDLFFRLWIPLFVIISGAVGEALAGFGRAACHVLKDRKGKEYRNAQVLLKETWPALVFALLFGYSLNVAWTGGEHLLTTGEYMRDRHALSFNPGQVETLLAQSRPEERVVYSGTMPMAFYFAHGALQRGAVYYHPAYSGTGIETEWLSRPDLRFAVAYNPAVYHPALEGMDEKDRCISSPEYSFSPLSKPRRYAPILKEGFIPLQDFKWLEIHPMGHEQPRGLRILIRNPQGVQRLEVVPVEPDGSLRSGQTAKAEVAAHWTGWVHVDLPEDTPGGSYRLIPPRGPNGLALGGIGFDDNRLHWPWEQKAKLTLFAKDPVTGQVTLDFDPGSVVPPALALRQLEVVDDTGSSVLLRVGP